MLGLQYKPFDQPVHILAPRSVNARTVRRYMPTDRKSSSDEPQPYAQRRIKQAPAPTSLELSAARRRQMLHKVNDQRQDAQYERRMDDMLRAEFLKQQRQWQTELNQQELVEEIEEEDAMQAEQELVEAQEQQELEALLQYYQDNEPIDDSEHYGSDNGEELEYLMDKVYEEYSQAHQSQDTGEAMDTS